MKTVFVAFGANLGDPPKTFQMAMEFIASHPEIHHLRHSTAHWTEPVDSIPESPIFLNAVCQFETTLSAKELAAFLQKIEKDLGKTPKPKEIPRKIDLDLLFYGTETIQERDLEVPHPRWRGRLFVLKPLAELVTRLPVPNASGTVEIIDIQKLIQEIEQYEKSACSQI
jgi:2-amino-4-hydroxy-6-hydroxymethyldihydropteridine diphosphokinase